MSDTKNSSGAQHVLLRDEAARKAIDAELSEITGGAVTSINQTEKLTAWLTAHGVPCR